MSRYAAMFRRSGNAGVFGAFVMLGDPDLERCAAVLDQLVAGGADMIEVGIPFSDPVADGPVVQAAGVRALANGTTPGDCFALLAAFRARHRDVPVGILTYANLVLARGRDDFYRRAAEAGVDSVLVADVPVLEAAPYAAAARAHKAMLDGLREAGAAPPVFGFGISRPDQVRGALAAGAAGAISGSAIVERVARGEDVAPFVREMKAATL
jgi:tryptophan synthase alpha chain